MPSFAYPKPDVPESLLKFIDSRLDEHGVKITCSCRNYRARAALEEQNSPAAASCVHIQSMYGATVPSKSVHEPLRMWVHCGLASCVPVVLHPEKRTLSLFNYPTGVANPPLIIGRKEFGLYTAPLSGFETMADISGILKGYLMDMIHGATCFTCRATHDNNRESYLIREVKRLYGFKKNGQTAMVSSDNFAIWFALRITRDSCPSCTMSSPF
jgi:hypothetical protein